MGVRPQKKRGSTMTAFSVPIESVSTSRRRSPDLEYCISIYDDEYFCRSKSIHFSAINFFYSNKIKL